MNERELIRKTASWLQERWGVELPEDQSEFDEREELLAFLRIRLQYLIEHDFEYLVNTMYRLDIPEAKFHVAMMAGGPVEASRELAVVVLDREIQRMETRIRYSRRFSKEEE